jgi:hypothetical protein
VIPESVTVADDDAFEACSKLNKVVFCDEIEEFVSAIGW